MDELASARALVIRQKKEWTEILTGFETRNQYAVMDARGRELATAVEVGGSMLARLFLRALRPFEIRQGDRAVGKITKRWSGLGKEMFTDADNFGVEFPPEWEPSRKLLFLGAVFLVDFVHFENKGN